MILKISKNYQKEMEADTYHLSTEMLNVKSTHLFIASNKWDEVDIELDPAIITGYLKYIPMTTEIVKVKIPEKLTDVEIHQLTELFPKKSGLIRKAYMQKGDVSEVLSGCLVQ